MKTILVTAKVKRQVLNSPPTKEVGLDFGRFLDRILQGGGGVCSASKGFFGFSQSLQTSAGLYLC
jgi:hypothetical protein